MAAASDSALWSIHTMTFCSASPSGLTDTAASFSPRTTSEHVASKAMALMDAAVMDASRRCARRRAEVIAVVTAAQISALEC